LSDARNKGVAESRGELIAFVDGDDVVSPYYLSSLVSAMGTTKKHCMVFGGIKTVSFSKDVQEKRITWERPEEFKELTRDEVLSAILYDEIQPAACAKLASREIYEEVPFPVGVHYEEIRTILKFIQKVDTYKVFDKDIYGYVMRKGSITWSSKVSTQQLKEYREAIDIICVDAAKINPTAVEAIRYQRALLDARAHSQLPKDARNCPNIKLIDDQIIKDLHKVLRLNLKNHQVRISSKLRFLLLVYARPIYDRLYCIFRKKVKKVK
jgi:glycosyltransferase involved in cell wall biosynthesis